MNQGFYGFPKTASHGTTDYCAGKLLTTNPGNSYTNIQNINDANDTSSGNANTGVFPQYIQADLGQNYIIRSSRMLFTDQAHSSKDGYLSCSDDGTNWTTVLTWSGESRTERVVTFYGKGRYWRLNTTAPFTAGSGINMYTWTLVG